jgi:hypothetical protein
MALRCGAFSAAGASSSAASLASSISLLNCFSCFRLSVWSSSPSLMLTVGSPVTPIPICVSLLCIFYPDHFGRSVNPFEARMTFDATFTRFDERAGGLQPAANR